MPPLASHMLPNTAGAGANTGAGYAQSPEYGVHQLLSWVEWWMLPPLYPLITYQRVPSETLSCA
jgi:hypothetical protein